ncbi:transmembrane protein 272 isoform X2 [Falco naumanni]|uniref:transmembrane protein 272 isoform X2 n=1 Tax=Falco naumanni TaxID=148594 RepID=UPI001ADEA9E5|nr:transmembrane protein 272 isoform X2 [Falco naumanni]
MTAGLEKACHRCISKIASNACFIFGLLTFLALPLSMTFIGMKFLEDCPVQPLIPLYLLVGGVIGSLKVTLLLYDSTRMRQLLSKSVVIDDDDDDEYPWRQNAHNF